MNELAEEFDKWDEKLRKIQTMIYSDYTQDNPKAIFFKIRKYCIEESEGGEKR